MAEPVSKWSQMTGAGKVGTGIGMVGSAAGAIGAWASAFMNYSMEKAQAQEVRNGYLTSMGQKYQYEASAYLHEKEAEEYAKQAGEYQLSGRKAAEQRTMQLGQDIGHVYAGAAGSGIEASSATARHVEKGLRTLAASDVDTINQNAQKAAWGSIRQASKEKQEAIWDTANAKISEYNAQIAINKSDAMNARAKANLGLGILSAVGQTAQAIGGGVALF